MFIDYCLLHLGNSGFSVTFFCVFFLLTVLEVFLTNLTVLRLSINNVLNIKDKEEDVVCLCRKLIANKTVFLPYMNSEEIIKSYWN